MTDTGLSIETTMYKMKDESQKKILSSYFKTGSGQYGENDIFLGIKVPETRKIVSLYWKDCTLKDIEYLLKSKYHEIRLCGLLILERQFRCHRSREIVDFYLNHLDAANNWDLVDLSCYKILGQWLFDNTEERPILYEMAKHGKSIWEQRIAIVSCLPFVKQGDFDDCLKIADILISSHEDLIHKAVGWLLRCVGDKNQEILENWITSRHKRIPRTTLRYAIEHFSKEDRAKILSL